MFPGLNRIGGAKGMVLGITNVATVVVAFCWMISAFAVAGKAGNLNDKNNTKDITLAEGTKFDIVWFGMLIFVESILSFLFISFKGHWDTQKPAWFAGTAFVLWNLSMTKFAEFASYNKFYDDQDKSQSVIKAYVAFAILYWLVQGIWMVVLSLCVWKGVGSPPADPYGAGGYNPPQTSYEAPTGGDNYGANQAYGSENDQLAGNQAQYSDM